MRVIVTAGIFTADPGSDVQFLSLFCCSGNQGSGLRGREREREGGRESEGEREGEGEGEGEREGEGEGERGRETERGREREVGKEREREGGRERERGRLFSMLVRSELSQLL